MNDNRKDDKILILTVAGFVVAGAVGVALIAGGGEETSAERAPIASVPKLTIERPAPAPVIPASRHVEPVQPEPEPDPEPVASIEPTFQIDPEADPVKAGHGHYAAGEYVEATAYFLAAVDATPGNAWARYMLGLSQWKSGDLEPAATTLVEAAAQNPDSVRARVNQARVLNELDRFDEALTAADEAIAIDGDNGEAWFLRARSLRNLDRDDEALDALETSVSLDSENGYAANLLGLIRIERGDFAEAATALVRAAELRPDVAYIRNNLGVALERSGDSAGALAAFRTASELDPTHAKALASVARLEPLVTVVDEGVVVAEEEPADPAEVETTDASGDA